MQVIQDLEKRGMKTVTQIEEIPNGQKVIFRSHGEPLSTYQKAQQKGLQIQDLTFFINFLLLFMAFINLYAVLGNL